MRQLKITIEPEILRLFQMWLAGEGKDAQRHLSRVIREAIQSGIRLPKGMLMMVKDEALLPTDVGKTQSILKYNQSINGFRCVNTFPISKNRLYTFFQVMLMEIFTG